MVDAAIAGFSLVNLESHEVEGEIETLLIFLPYEGIGEIESIPGLLSNFFTDFRDSGR